MGRVNDDYMAAQQQGWDEVDKLVCSECVDEPDLWRLGAAELTHGDCDYCQKEGAEILPVTAIQRALYSVVRAYYAEPGDAGTPYDEGSYIIELTDTDEVLGNLGFYPTDELLKDILDADNVGSWVKAANGSWAGSHEHQVMLGSWSTFTQVVKHQTRFHFQRMTDDRHSQEIGVADMLAVVAEELGTLIREVEPGASVFRARHLTDAEIAAMNSEIMGAPPKEHASAGRMNPAGISYFYASLDDQTALREIGNPQTGKTPVAAKFVVNRPLRVIDLTRLPDEPSIFAIDLKHERERVRFLGGFVDSITQTVTKDGQEHIDYVPSQVVCEYLAQAFSVDGRPLDGVIFPSTVQSEGINMVLFPSGKWFEPVQFKSLDYAGRA